jgi:hypothetical protein
VNVGSRFYRGYRENAFTELQEDMCSVCMYTEHIFPPHPPRNSPQRCFLSAFRRLTCIDRCMRGAAVRRGSDSARQWTVSAFGVPV